MSESDAPVPASLLAAAIWSAAGLILASVGVWTGTTLTELSDAVGGLRTSVMLLEQKIGVLPPPELMLRVTLLEKERDKHDEEIHRIAKIVEDLNDGAQRREDGK